MKQLFKPLSKLPAHISLLFCGVFIGAISMDFAIYILMTFQPVIISNYILCSAIIFLLVLGFFFNNLHSNEVQLIDPAQKTLDIYLQGGQ